MTIQEVIKSELDKCNKSPYYFATTYLTITSTDGFGATRYKTNLTEEQFNREYFRLQGHNNLRKSERLEEEAKKEDNDLKALGIMNKALREKRAETWEEWRHTIFRVEDVEEFSEENGLVTLNFRENSFLYEKYGKTIQYYPKANKVHINETNEWIQPGLRWLINKIY